MSASSPSTTSGATVEETLAYEAERRPRAATIAIAAGLLSVLGNVLLTILTSGGPTESDGFISVTDSLRARIAGEEPEGPSLLVGQIDHWGDNAPLLSLSTVLTTLAVIGLGLTILFLYRATAARTAQVGRVPYYATLAGLVVYPIGRLLRELTQWIAAADFADAADRSAGAAKDVFATPLYGIGYVMEIAGMFALAVGVVLVALNAMRVGLLTRFFGILGILAGVLTVFQADQPGIVRAFWLVGVGLVIGGRISVPRAWHTGRAEPWPTQQQLREWREAAAGNAPAQELAEPTEDQSTAPTPAHARKKRKRRR